MTPQLRNRLKPKQATYSNGHKVNYIQAKLPGGHFDSTGNVHLEAELVPLSGREEEYLANRQNKESASLVTTILSRCVRRIGDIKPVSEEVARNLLVADRQFLLLKLREMTFGDQVQSTVFCPWPNCGNRVDIDFSTKDIPIQESEDKGPIFTMRLSSEAVLNPEGGVQENEIVFRLPNGGDQEALATLIVENEAAALTALLLRCIQQLGSSSDCGQEQISRLSPLARMEIEQRMEALAPKIDLTLGANCPECHRDFTMPFDLQQFFFGEWKTSHELLCREVHYLAYHYHWSEEEIMDFPREKRRKYIEVLAEEIERLNNVV